MKSIILLSGTHDLANIRLTVFLSACAWLAVPVASADEMAAGIGHGNLKSHGSNALFLSYLKDAPKLFNRESSYDLAFAYWSGPNYNTALTVGRALRWKISQKSYFTGEIGIGLVERTTDHLGTSGEFIARLAFGRKFGKYELSIGETHYSNGKTSLRLNWHGPNTGDDFLTVMLAREL